MSPTRLVSLLKAVPEREDLPFDPVLRTVERGTAKLRLNPLDGRALGVGLSLRAPGEELVVLSMGPVVAEEVLREGLAAGADRAVLVTDPALAGSDTLVTARAIAAAVRALSASLVIAGAFSTDSGTGTVPPEIGGFLDWPTVTHARSLRRVGDGSELLVTRDVAGGWERVRLALPAVVSVGEKILKPPKPGEPERAVAASRPIERWDLRRLDLQPSVVGLAGSPSSVRELRRVAPDRQSQMFAEGTVGKRVAAALEALRSRASTETSTGTSRNTADRAGEVWVVVTDGTGSLDAGALAVVAEVRRNLPKAHCRAITIGRDPEIGHDPGVLRCGADSLLELRSEDGPGDSVQRAAALDHALRTRSPPSAVLLMSDPEGREVAGRVAARRGLALVGDATGIGRDDAGELQWWKPSFGESYLAGIGVRGPSAIVTIRPGAFAPPAPGSPVTIRETERIDLPEVARRVCSEERGREGDPLDGDLGSAVFVVTVGLGIGGPAGIDALRPTVRRWGAALGATRQVVDAGWMPVDRQVGLTGRALAPQVALLLGVGKGANHVIGLRRAGRIIAVNPDPAAPVFRFADVGIVAGWAEALPFLDPLVPLAQGHPAPPV